jgi:hypothetical protein
MLAKLDSRTSGDVSQRTSGISLNGDSNSRRESVESRMNTGFEGMRLQNSPYASNNQSTTSIQASLQQQRNPGNNTGPERLSASRFTPVYTPSSAHFGSDAHKRSKVAPTITGPADSSVAHGAVPIAGQAWAFPTDIDHRMPSSGRSSEAESRQTSYIESRRSSLASLASSQYTTESRLPPGQRRLDEVYPQEYRNSRASSEFQGASHHHHSLQHRQVGDLRDEEGGSPGGSQPYSRTPELRVSHKLAERKRRNEMKELYEELRDLMPQERGNKASKWEILSKGRPFLTLPTTLSLLTVFPQLSLSTSISRTRFVTGRRTSRTARLNFRSYGWRTRRSERRIWPCGKCTTRRARQAIPLLSVPDLLLPPITMLLTRTGQPSHLALTLVAPSSLPCVLSILRPCSLGQIR